MGRDEAPVFDVQKHVASGHPIIQLKAEHADIKSSWTPFLPFALYIMSLLKPRRLVELGVFRGLSFLTFCQAVKHLGLNTFCYGIDNWEGDQHIGVNRREGSRVYYKLIRDIAVNQYDPFAILHRGDFQQASTLFVKPSIDLLHIDGTHTYEAVKEDFYTWLPKMSSRGVVLFHDTRIFDEDFGVWKFWEEIKYNYPAMELDFSCGLGVLAVGSEVEPELLDILRCRDKQCELIDLMMALGSEYEQK